MATTIDSISHGRFGIKLITDWQPPEYTQMGLWPSDEHFRNRYDVLDEYARILRELWESGRTTPSALARASTRQPLSLPKRPAGEVRRFPGRRGSVGNTHTTADEEPGQLIANLSGFLNGTWRSTFFDAVALCLTNNAEERALRCVPLGRKAWIFCCSDRGGWRAGIMFALIQSCRLNDVDPQAWLADVLARIAGHPANRLGDLLSWNWKPTGLKLES